MVAPIVYGIGVGAARLGYMGYKAYKAYRQAKKLKQLKDLKDKADKLKKAKEAADKAAKAKKKCTGNCDKPQARCVLRPYKPDTCKPGRTGHHVVPDRVFRVGKRGSARIKGGVSESEGLVICVDGPNLDRSREHGKIHALYDPAEAAAGLANKGVAPLGALELAGAAAAGKVTGCNPALLAAQLRAYHAAKGLGASTPVRADPTGKLPVNPSSVGIGATPIGGPRR